ASAAPEAVPQPLQWTVVEGQATFKGRPLADKTVRVIDALTDEPAKALGAGATTADLGESALAVQAAGELKTDAEGRYRLAIAGLTPGAAARIVVASGESGLTTLVPGSAVAGPKPYRVATQLMVGTNPLTGATFLLIASGRVQATTNEDSTLHAHLFNGAVALHEMASRNNPAPPPPPMLIYPTQPISPPPGDVPLPPPLLPPHLPHLPNQLVSETDPQTGGLKLTEAMLQMLERQRQEMLQEQEEQRRQLEEDQKQGEKNEADLLDQLDQLSDPSQGDPAALERRADETLGPNEALKQKLAEVERMRRQKQQLQEQNKQEELRRRNEELLDKIKQTKEELQRQNEQAQEEKRKEAEERHKEQLSETLRKQLEERRRTQSHQDSAVKQAVSNAGPQAKQSLLDMNAQALKQAAERPQPQAPGQPPISVPLHGTGLNASITEGGLNVTDRYGKRLDVNQDDVAQLISNMKQTFPSLNPPSSSGGGSSSPATPAPPADSIEVTTTSNEGFAELLTEITLGTAPGDIVVDGEHLWVALPALNQVLRIPGHVTSETKEEIKRFENLPGAPRALALADSGMVYALCGDKTIARLDATSPTTTLTMPANMPRLERIEAISEALFLADDTTLWWFADQGAELAALASDSVALDETITDLALDLEGVLGEAAPVVATTKRLYRSTDQGTLTPAQVEGLPTQGLKALSFVGDCNCNSDSGLFAIDRATGKLMVGVKGS
ncbi:MAG: hypothetical protein ACLGIN_11050, partial [Candidatus Sericytochromatia bacterium]